MKDLTENKAAKLLKTAKATMGDGHAIQTAIYYSIRSKNPAESFKIWEAAGRLAGFDWQDGFLEGEFEKDTEEGEF